MKRSDGFRWAPRLILGVAATAVAFGACRPGAPVSTEAPRRRELPALALGDSVRPALIAVGRAVLDDALNRTTDTAAVCVVFVGPDRREFRPEPADLRTLADSIGRGGWPRHFVSVTDCPRTYASMILSVDPRGNPVDPAPRGYVDPHILSIDVPDHWVPKPDERSITVTVRVGQGTGTDEYLCRVRPSAAREAMLRAEGRSRALTDAVTCRLERRYVS
jgi:hypothetical protein